MFFFFYSDLDKEVRKNSDKILNHLLKKYPQTPFILRRTDMNLMLDKGFWFYGGEGVIALSFWRGMDWIEKIPNISFVIDFKTNECALEIRTTDDYDKHHDVIRNFVPALNMIRKDEFTFRTELGGTSNVLTRVDYFIKEVKPIIDGIIDENYVVKEEGVKNSFGQINRDDFRQDLENVQKYRKRKRIGSLPVTLNSVDIYEYGDMENVHIQNLPSNSQWIFITGENGSGKSTFLRALTYNLCNGPEVSTDYKQNKFSLDIGITLDRYGKKPRHRIKALGVKQMKINSDGFVAIGPTRLNIQKEIFSKVGGEHDFTENLKNPYRPLFNSITPLLDLGYVMRVVKKGEIKGLQDIDDKLRFIVEALMQVCDDIVDIHVGASTEYFESIKGKKERVVSRTFSDLSSGYKNLIAMVTHMMIQLYIQQPEVKDPAELVGIVIIDEIELHAHPKMQIEIIQKLSKIFPRIQFIVSTHSPIPLLGAPSNSVILNVKRSDNGMQTVERIDGKVMFNRILPNAILNSPIFGLEDIVPRSKKKEDTILLGDDYKDIELYQKLESDIDVFMTNDKERELLNLFKSKP